MTFEMSDRLFNNALGAENGAEQNPELNEKIQEALGKESSDLASWADREFLRGKLDVKTEVIIDQINETKIIQLAEKLAFNITDLDNLIEFYYQEAKTKIKDKKEREKLAEDLQNLIKEVISNSEIYYRDILGYERSRLAIHNSQEEYQSERGSADRVRRSSHNALVRSLSDLYRFAYGPFPNKNLSSLADCGIILPLREKLFTQKLIEQANEEVKSSTSDRPACKRIAEWVKVAVPGRNLELLKGQLIQSLNPPDKS